MQSNFVPFEFSRAEAIGGLMWLSVGALLSLVLEVVYLGAHITMPNGVRIAFPLTVIVAWWFNKVLTKTARLWSSSFLIAAIPLLVFRFTRLSIRRTLFLVLQTAQVKSWSPSQPRECTTCTLLMIRN